MPVNKVKSFLDENQVAYVSVEYSGAFTAKEVSERTQIRGDQIAKTVMVVVDGAMSMVVLPSSCRIRWDRLSSVMGTDLMSLAEEDEFAEIFPGCDIGAMPPFGNLYDIPTYFYEEGFNPDEEIAFRAGTHSELIKIQIADYVSLAQPMTISAGFAKIGMKKPSWMRRKAA